jgi:hypothetical protein
MWRSFTATPSVYKCSLSPDCIDNIFIGLNFGGDASALAKEVKQEFPNAGVFGAIKRHGDLALDFVPL